MAQLGETIARLVRRRGEWFKTLDVASREGGISKAEPRAPHLRETPAFGSNPGALHMLSYVPDSLAPSPALVVVLHGCTQTAAGYDRGTGWSSLARRHGFALLLPEQGRANNPKRCFNWFQPSDITRDRGEALSIRQMVERMIVDHGIDRRRVYVTGLSAGGAMTAVMLATYPEVFAGGGIIAGLPYGCAHNVSEALEQMLKGEARSPRDWGALVRAASDHAGPWPRVSVWHGTADLTVKSTNAAEIVKQWADVHGLAATPSREDRVDGYPHRTWRNAAGEDVVEEYVVTGMAHGAPLATRNGDYSLGATGPFLLEAGISSSLRIARFFGLTSHMADERQSVSDIDDARPQASVRDEPFPPPNHIPPPWVRPGEGAESRAIDVGAVITKALKAAGLMK